MGLSHRQPWQAWCRLVLRTPRCLHQRAAQKNLAFEAVVRARRRRERRQSLSHRRARPAWRQAVAVRARSSLLVDERQRWKALSAGLQGCRVRLRPPTTVEYGGRGCCVRGGTEHRISTGHLSRCGSGRVRGRRRLDAQPKGRQATVFHPITPVLKPKIYRRVRLLEFLSGPRQARGLSFVHQLGQSGIDLLHRRPARSPSPPKGGSLL